MGAVVSIRSSEKVEKKGFEQSRRTLIKPCVQTELLPLRKTLDFILLYLNGNSSSSFQLGFGPSAVVVRQTVRWKETSTNGRTKTCTEIQTKEAFITACSLTCFYAFRKRNPWWSRWSSPDVTLRYTSNIALYRLLSIYEAFKIILYVSISRRWCVLRVLHILCTQGKQFFPQLHGNYWLTNHRKRLKQTWFSNQWRKVSLYPHIADKQLLPDTTNI